MDENSGHVELIKRAQFGYEGSMDQLAELVAPRLFAYIYRLTLNYDLAQDLMQDTLLKMVESLSELKEPERFWHWLFRTALGKAQHYYRDQRRVQMVQISTLSKERVSGHIWEDHSDGLSHVVRRELSEAICQAMARLRVSYRNVLILRCFEQMSYAEIAGLMDCKELRARVLFFRAKRSLRQQLSRGGFSKGLLLTALGLFGIITAPAKGASAAGTVTAASLDVGLVATLVGAAGTRLGVGIISAITALGIGLTLDRFLLVLAFLCFASICFVVALYME